LLIHASNAYGGINENVYTHGYHFISTKASTNIPPLKIIALKCLQRLTHVPYIYLNFLFKYTNFL